eukprot:8962018-Alexandrium_andersonii.AAC.1
MCIRDSDLAAHLDHPPEFGSELADSVCNFDGNPSSDQMSKTKSGVARSKAVSKSHEQPS